MARNTETAKAAYDRLDTDIVAMISELTALREGHREMFAATGSKDWGFPGDLGRVKELLTEALRQMGSPDYQEE